MTEIDRRTLLRNAAAGSVLIAFGGTRALDRGSPVEPSLSADPFTLGVASGDPLPDSVVLWTRLAPEPLTPSGGLDGVGNVRVGWEVAEDAAMQRVVRRGRSVAAADLAHAVHVDARGLRPGREYWYRFTVGDWATEPARTRTAPAAHDAVDAVNFAFCTCQKWEDGFYNAFAHLAEEDLDLVLHLGDYTYEYGIDPATGGVRGVSLPAEYAEETVTLDQFRLRHALYKTDADLQLAHARFPWVTVWDDHEVDNDYTADIPEDGTPPEQFRLRRIAGYQAFYEHLPLRSVARPDRRGQSELYRAITWGSMAEFDVVDTRQYRSDHPCGDGEHARCAASFDPEPDDARRTSGALAGITDAPQPSSVDRARQPGHGHRARPRPRPRHGPLAGFVGRLPGGATTDARGADDTAQPGDHHRRLALDVRQRHQVRLPERWFPDGGHRGHHAGRHVER